MKRLFYCVQSIRLVGLWSSVSQKACSTTVHQELVSSMFLLQGHTLPRGASASAQALSVHSRAKSLTCTWKVRWNINWHFSSVTLTRSVTPPVSPVIGWLRLCCSHREEERSNPCSPWRLVDKTAGRSTAAARWCSRRSTFVPLELRHQWQCGF